MLPQSTPDSHSHPPNPNQTMPHQTPPQPSTSHKAQPNSDPQPPPSRITKSKRELYFHHENVAESLAGKDVMYKQAAQRANQSAHAVKSAEKALEKMQQTEVELREKLNSLHARKLRNKLFPKKAGSEETRLLQHISAVESDVANVKDDISRAKQEFRQHAAACDDLRADAKALKASERTCRDILEKAFGGMDAGSPTENVIETQRDRLARATDRAKDRLAGQKQALILLKQAGTDLLNARNHLSDALVTNTVDLFSGGPVGFVAGLGSQYNVKNAADLARSAARKVERALELNDKLPKTQLAKVQDGVAVAFADIVLDGIVTDLLIRITIQRAVRSVDEALLALKDSVDQQTTVVTELDERVQRYSNDLKRTSDDLVRVRAELLHNISA